MKSVHQYLTERTISSKTIELINDPRLVDASYDDDLELVQELLDKNVDPNSTDSRGESPVSKWGGENKDVLELLLKYGADINHQNKRGETVLHNIAHRADEEDIQFLLKHGADKNILSNGGEDACMVAYNNNNDEIMDILKTSVTVSTVLSHLNFVDSVKEKGASYELTIELDYLMELFQESSRSQGYISTKTIGEILSGDYVDAYDYSGYYKDVLHMVDDHNLELFKKIAIKLGWDEEDEDMWEVLEENDITNYIIRAYESAENNAYYSDLQNIIDSVLENAGFEYDYNTQKAIIEIKEDKVWEKMKEGEISEITELFEEIPLVGSPDSYADDEDFNDILKEYLNEEL